MAFRLYPANFLEVDIGATDDNASSREAYAKFNFYLDKPDFINHTASAGWFSPHRFAKHNVKDYRLVKVRRHNDIVVETQAGGLTIGRGN